MIKTGFSLVLDLLKVCILCKVGIELLQKFIVQFGLARSIKNQTRLIESRAECFFCRISNSALSPYDVQGFMFCPRYKKETIATCLRLLYFCCCMCESLVRSRGGCLHTCLGLSRRRFYWELDGHSVAALKSLKIHKRVCL